MATDIVPAGGVSTAADGQAQARPGGKALVGGGGRVDVETTLAGLKTSRDGLAAAEAGRRLAETGPNVIADKRRSVLAEVGSFFWGPILWMIEVALSKGRSDPSSPAPPVV